MGKTFGRIWSTLKVLGRFVRYIVDVCFFVIGLAGIPDDAEKWKTWLSGMGVDMSNAPLPSFLPFVVIALSLFWFGYMIWSDFIRKEKPAMTSEKNEWGSSPTILQNPGDDGVAAVASDNANQTITTSKIERQVNFNGSGPASYIEKADISVGRPPFEMGDDDMARIVAMLNDSRQTFIIFAKDGLSEEPAQRLRSYLLSHSINYSGMQSIDVQFAAQLPHRITISPNGFRFGSDQFFGGAQTIAIYATKP